MVVGAQDEPPTNVCEPVAVNLSLLAANVSRRVWIVSPNVSPRKLMFASRDNYVCKPQHLVGNHLIRRCWRCGLSAYHNIGQNERTPHLSITTYYRQVTLSENILCLASLYAVERPQWTHSTSDKTGYVALSGSTV